MNSIKETKEREINVITPLVLEIQNGNDDKWKILYLELSNHKAVTLKSLKYKRMRGVDMADINALYDDALLETVIGKTSTRFEYNKSENFCMFFENILKQKSERFMRYLNSKCRKGSFNTLSFNGEPDSSAITENDLIDDGVSDSFHLVDSTLSMQKILYDFLSQSEKNREKVELLLLSSKYVDMPQSERKKAIMSNFTEENWETVRKRITRARNELKLFIEKN